MRPISWAALVMGVLGSALVLAAGCSTVPVPPTYTQEELQAQCERGNGWWHPDDLRGEGFCEPVHD
jgi:hypothetical protein